MINIAITIFCLFVRKAPRNLVSEGLGQTRLAAKGTWSRLERTLVPRSHGHKAAGIQSVLWGLRFLSSTSERAGGRQGDASRFSALPGKPWYPEVGEDPGISCLTLSAGIPALGDGI